MIKREGYAMMVNVVNGGIFIDDLYFKKIELEFIELNLNKHYQDERAKKYTLHKYGNQLFCKFKMSEKINKKGIYIFVFDNEVKYLGECINLYSRINNGYGNISPRNCYVGGQMTNCKINGIINTSKNKGIDISLFYHETDIKDFERKQLETKLINKIDLVNKGYNGKY